MAAASTLAAFLIGVPGSAPAQQDNTPEVIRVAPQSGAQVEPWDIQAAMQKQRSQFRLFGEGDRAWTSLRMVGDNVIWETNTGPGDDAGGPMFGLFSPITQFSTPTGAWFQSFGIPIMVGAPRSEWVRYLVEGVESLRNATGDPPGFTVMWNGETFARPKDFNAADGLVGTLIAGVTSTEDGSCLDHSATLGGAALSGGFQLLPASGCSPTIPGGVWRGDRPIPTDGWVDHADSVGTEFAFNRWQVPDFRKDGSAFLGNNVSTYGHFNDYNSNVLNKFGNVVPGGTGPTSRQGYPLGLDFFFDAFTFTLPTVANAKFWSALIVNNSEQLYGVPHDYDSLYIGFGPWPGRAQDGDNYAVPELGAFVSAESSPAGSAECAKVDPIPLLGQQCGAFDGGDPDGFEAGAFGMIVLKSPIGDLRNKLFTDPSSPFNGMGDPQTYGDTITFNHLRNWNFGPWGAVWNAGSNRRQFGVMSSISEATLDGEACADFAGGSLFDIYSTFNSNDWPNNQCAYTSFVPGDWTYVTGRPEGQPMEPDTLHLSNCGPPGCPVTWADTTWQGWSSVNFANLAQFSIGPFRLEAGDTTELMIAMYSARDSVPFEALTTGIVDFYLGLFAGPEAPPQVTIRNLDLGAGLQPGQSAEVTLVWDDAAEDFVDPFMDKFADDMENAPPGTELAVIRDANPGIVDRIRERARDNLEQLLVFKSCDGGNTFDANGDCEGDPATDAQGNTVEPGWQAFATLEPDATGDAPNTFTDGDVTPGVTYLYTILGQSKGFEAVVVDDPNARVDTFIDTSVTPADTQIVFNCGPDPCSTTELVVAPSLLNPLSRSAADPNVASVYVPASLAAGAVPARVNFQTRTIDNFGQSLAVRDLAANSTVPFDVQLTSRDIRDNLFAVRFANFIRVIEETNANTGEINRTTVILQSRARTVTETGTTVTEQALESASFTREDGVAVQLNDATPVDETTSGNVVTRTFQIGPGDLDPDSRDAVGFVLVENTDEGEVKPLLVSGDLGGESATPGGFLSHPEFPGFLVSADNSSAGSFNQQVWTANGDTLSTQLDPSLALDAAASVNTGIQGQTFGEYILEFTDSVFGPASPFRLNFTNPSATDAEFDQSLAAREAATTGVTDDEAVQLVATATNQDPADVTLAPVRIPFRVRNLTHGRTAELAMIDAGERSKQLGVGQDTVTVTVAANEWIPGDDLFVIEELNVFRTRDVGGQEAIVVDGSGDPIMETQRRITFSPLTLDCSAASGSNPTCNPVRGQGGATQPGGAWIGVSPGDVLHTDFFTGFDPVSRFAFIPKRSVSPDDVLGEDRSIRAQMRQINVVPNPYLYFSEYEASTAQRRIMFTNLPPDGELRIYTIAGNFVQELDWRPSDLVGNGDLFWNMQTREGNELAAGLYLFVVTATDPATGEELKHMGKFVVIR